MKPNLLHMCLIHSRVMFALVTGLESTFEKNGKAIFFDSFGRSPENLGFLQFLEKHAKTWQYNNKCVQSMVSGVCGQHVICFFLYIQKMSAWLKLFQSSLLINDETVHSMIENKFKIKAPLYPDIQIFT